MPLKLRIKGGLIRCGRCGKRYSSPLAHVCAVRMDSKRKPGRSRLKAPAVTLAKCGSCSASYSNPLTHVCKAKSDFKRRAAAQGGELLLGPLLKGAQAGTSRASRLAADGAGRSWRAVTSVSGPRRAWPASSRWPVAHIVAEE